MRRVRYLQITDYIVPIANGGSQILTLSNCYNVTLERTWHYPQSLQLKIHAKYNSNLMNGINILAKVDDGILTKSAHITECTLYRVSDADYSETLIGVIPLTQSSTNIFTANVNQTTLTSSNELSGKETYSITCKALRRRSVYKQKVWFNHIGCFDNINQLRNETNYLLVSKTSI